MFGQQAGASGGFGGFGGNQNNTPNTGNTNSVFGSGGGFGAQPSGTTGFGNTGGGFGSNTANAFGSSTTPNTAFGGGGGGFGQSNNAFGAAKPAFGAATTGGGLFGSNSAAPANTSTGFGFGNTPAPSGFSTANTGAVGGGMFGSKPAFGATATSSGASGGLFGTAGATNTGAFGAQQSGTTGFGATNSSSQQLPMQGSATVPYTVTQEKEANANMTNHFQPISFMPAYKNWSFEELRFQDYSQGRRYGNESGQSGAFGFGTFGGASNPTSNTTGFGATNTGAAGGGLFGNTGGQTGGFGATAGGAFGGTQNPAAGGGLFGAKPATGGGGLFGSNNTGATGGGGGLFGATGATNTGAFGSTAAPGAFGSTQATGGAFGAANQAQAQNKGFSFGNPTTTATTPGFGAATGTGFGQGAATGGGGLFGQQPQQAQQTTGFGAQPAATGFGGTGAFGSNPQQQQQQQQPAPFGGAGFGAQQQQKSVFGTGFGGTGAAPATGGLFGQQQQAQPQQQGGLFGSKPAFGAPLTTTTASGGLFGTSNQPQQQQTNGLFGSTQPATTGGLFSSQPGNNGGSGGLFGQSQPKPAGTMFGTLTTPQTQGGGLFGNLNTSTGQPAGGSSLFGGQQQQQQQQQLGGSLFGSTFGSAQQQQQQPQFTTSISDSPYGNTLLGSMGPGQQNSPLGPIATPLNGSQTKKAAMIPHHKIAPRQPALTPRLGSSYSRSGSPFAASVSGNASLGGGGSLGRSFSTNNKLSLFDSDDSILSPGAFSSNGNNRVASLKKLVIDKKIKDQDLFTEGSELQTRNENVNGRGSPATKGILKKTVSFDVASNGKREDEDLFGVGGSDTPVRPTSGPAPTVEELGYIRRTPERRRPTDIDEPSRGVSPVLASESEPVTGNEVALVQQTKEDRTHGTYWMVPNAAKLRSYTREQQKKVIGLTVGRRGFGSVRFENPVDITGLPVEFEDIPGTVVIFDIRVCTVYPERMDKPPPGKGLNVPATISLEECFPLTKNQRDKIVDPEHPRYITHIRRLKGIKDTEFVDYHPQQGHWIFKVRHFTTYGLVESDDDEDEVTYEDESSYTTGGETPTPRPAIVTPASLLIDDESGFTDIENGNESSVGLDDTFDFKRTNAVGPAHAPAGDQYPGSFLGHESDDASYDEEYDEDENEGDVTIDATMDSTMDGESFLEEGSVGSIEEEDEPAEPTSEGDVVDELTTIVEDEDEDTSLFVADTPRKFAMALGGSPEKAIIATPKALPMGRDWTEQLNNTISPVKRRFGGESFFAAGNKSTSPKKLVMQPLNYGLLDLANDLYASPTKMGSSARKDIGKTRKREQSESPLGSKSGLEGIRPAIKMASPARLQSVEPFDFHSLEGDDQAWRKSVRPTWGPEGMVIHMGQLEALRVRKNEDSLSITKVDFGIKPNHVPKPLELQLRVSDIRLDEFGVPFAEMDINVVFREFAKLAWPDDARGQHERDVWKLASVLWDPLPSVPTLDRLPDEEREYANEKRRVGLLSRFLEELVEKDADRHALSATTIEEAAFAHLTAHRIEQACAMVLEGGDVRLATLLPLLGGDKNVRRQVRKQLDHWRNKGVLSEISIPIRSLYALVAGETCYTEGVKSPAEDATPSVFLAEHFGLDWKRALALKLWYGCVEGEGVAALVQKYEDDFIDYPEKVARPGPWHLDTFDGEEPVMGILWGLLRLYADASLPLEEVLSPVDFGTNRIDYRLSWQLRTILAKLGVRDFSGGELMYDDFSYRGGSKADQNTTDFAGGLENAGLWEWALFVIMHIHDAESRGAAIKNIIGKHIDDIDEGEKLVFLEKRLQIPRTWIYEAKALRARHAGEFLQEAEYLILAKAWNEAHKTIVQQVAPEAIISSDLQDLKTILGKFQKSDRPENWGLGGQVYLDFIRLQELNNFPKAKAKAERRDVAGRLLGALKNMERKAFLQNIAVREMAGVVGALVLKTDDMASEKTKVLELPLTEDQYLKKTVNLTLEYYKAKLQGISVQ